MLVPTFSQCRTCASFGNFVDSNYKSCADSAVKSRLFLDVFGMFFCADPLSASQLCRQPWSSKLFMLWQNFHKHICDIRWLIFHTRRIYTTVLMSNPSRTRKQIARHSAQRARLFESMLLLRRLAMVSTREKQRRPFVWPELAEEEKQRQLHLQRRALYI